MKPLLYRICMLIPATVMITTHVVFTHICLKHLIEMEALFEG